MTSTDIKNFNYYPLNPEITQKHSIVEYIWFDGSGRTLRGKTRVYADKIIKTLSDLDWWTYDGSSTEQAITNDSEIWIKPVFLCKDPFRKNGCWLCLCDGYKSDKVTRAVGNFRPQCEKIMNEAKGFDPWFGIEQEYFLYVRQGTTHKWPLGWPQGGFPFPQGQYYCGIGDSNVFGRSIAEAHLRLCLDAGLKMAGLNAEVAPGQWEFQVGIAKGIEIADHLWIARYILLRLGEEWGLDIVLDPKPVKGEWNGSGAHINYSTKDTRNKESGLKAITDDHLVKLKEKHMEHIFVYGEGNKYRMIGTHETAVIDKFNYGIGTRGMSVRIPVGTAADKYGYYEDRRPASNVNPYISCAILVDTTCLNSKYCMEIIKSYKEFRKLREERYNDLL